MQNFTTANSSIQTFVPPQAVKEYDFSVRNDAQIDGTIFESNQSGRVVGAHYKSGAVVKIHENCMIVRAEDFSLWFADSQKHFHPID